jgi:hypothetical protein
MVSAVPTSTPGVFVVLPIRADVVVLPNTRPVVFTPVAKRVAPLGASITFGDAPFRLNE